MTRTLARERDKAELLRRLRRLHPRRVGSWGRMSAHQMVCHLSDALRMATGNRPVSCNGTLAGRTVGKWLLLYGPFAWPRAMATRPELDQERGGTGPLDFDRDVAQLEALVELITMRTDLAHRRHPQLGHMSDAAWLRWAYLHIDHHLRQFGI